MKTTLYTLLISLALTGCSSSNSVKSSTRSTIKVPVESSQAVYLKGIEAQKKGYFKQAVKLYQKAANQGYHLAQNALGVKYGRGQGVPQDHKKAFYWLKRSTDQAPSFNANFNLALLYIKGIGVDKDYTKAINNFQIASQLGNVDATNWLGQIYEKGLGVDLNIEKARLYYIDAAKKGDSAAINNLGNLAQRGKKYQQARQWYEKAKKLGSKVAIKNIDALNKRGL